MWKTDESNSIFDIDHYKNEESIEWFKSLRIYELVKLKRIVRPNLVKHLSDLDFTIYLTLLCFLHKYNLKEHNRVNKPYFYRHFSPRDSKGIILRTKLLKRYMYRRVGNSYYFYVVKRKEFGKDCFYIVDDFNFRLVRSLASGIHFGKEDYPCCAISGVSNQLHVYLFNKKVKIVDHVNGLRFDCRMKNLREADHSSNSKNTRSNIPKVFHEFFIGVRRFGVKWTTTLNNNNFYTTALEAAKAFDIEVGLNSPLARTNKIMGYY